MALWFVTFVTHNSRVSERMVAYGIKRGEPYIFEANERVLMATKLAEAIHRYDAQVSVWNILPDHVHLVIAAPSETDLNELIRKIKGYSSFAFLRALNYDKGQIIWARKFHRVYIDEDNMMSQIMQYVTLNHQKHLDTWGEELVVTWERYLKSIIEGSCTPIEELL